MIVRRSNNFPNIYDLFSYGVGKDSINEGKNFAFDNCLEFIMDKLGENHKLDYWIITGITGNGYTPVYSKSDVTTTCVYCVSDFIAGPDYVSYVFDAIGYSHTYVTAAQINTDRTMYIEKLKEYIRRGVPVIAICNSNTPSFSIDALIHYLYVGHEDYEKSFLFSKIADAALYNELNAMDFIPQDWVFVGEKNTDIPLIDICRNAVIKLPYWLMLPERDGVFFGASAFRAWADDIEAGRYDSEIDMWHNYVIYICTLATIAWANNVIDAPYASVVNRLAQIAPRYANLSAQIAEQYFILGDENGSSGFCKNGIWRDLEDLGGGFNCSRDAFRNKENRAKIAAKFHEAADCINNVVQILQNS